MANFSDPTLLYQQDVDIVAERIIKETIGSNATFPIDLFSIIDAWDIEVKLINDVNIDFQARIELGVAPCITINSEFSLEDIKSNNLPLIKNNNLRFSLAHELGHLFLNINSAKLRERMLINNTKRNADMYTKITEFQADNFASALLMPKYAMTDYLNYGNNPKSCAETISNHFGCSLTSAFLRLARINENIVACLQVDKKTRTIKHLTYSKSWKDIGHEYYPYKELFICKQTILPKLSATNSVLKNSESSAKNIKNKMNLTNWFENYDGDYCISEWPYLFEHNIITFLEVEYPDF